MSQKLDNLSALDWDDTALIKAYDRGMTLKVKDCGAGKSKVRKHNSNRKEWKEGDFCQALYPSDGVMYEAKILSICDDVCIVDFLGYDEELEVDVNTLIESGGKKARRKQIRRASKPFNQSYHLASNDESFSGDDTRHNESSLMYSKKKQHHYNNHGNQVLNHSVTDYNTTAAAESTFHAYQAAPHYPAHVSNSCNPVPPPSMLAPGFPPMPPCSNLSQDPSLAAMMTSWYMAGYYTGLHQAQKNQRCCHASQNCCRH